MSINIKSTWNLLPPMLTSQFLICLVVFMVFLIGVKIIIRHPKDLVSISIPLTNACDMKVCVDPGSINACIGVSIMKKCTLNDFRICPYVFFCQVENLSLASSTSFLFLFKWSYSWPFWSISCNMPELLAIKTYDFPRVPCRRCFSLFGTISSQMPFSSTYKTVNGPQQTFSSWVVFLSSKASTIALKVLIPHSMLQTSFHFL